MQYIINVHEYNLNCTVHVLYVCKYIIINMWVCGHAFRNPYIQLAIIEFNLPAATAVAAFYSKNRCISHTQDDVTTMTNGPAAHARIREYLIKCYIIIKCVLYMCEHILSSCPGSSASNFYMYSYVCVVPMHRIIMDTVFACVGVRTWVSDNGIIILITWN